MNLVVIKMTFMPFMEKRKINVKKVKEASTILYEAMNYPKSENKKLGTRYIYGQIMHRIVGDESGMIELK